MLTSGLQVYTRGQAHLHVHQYGPFTFSEELLMSLWRIHGFNRVPRVDMVPHQSLKTEFCTKIAQEEH